MTSEKAFQLYFAIRLYYKSGFDIFQNGTNFKGKNEVSERNDFSLITPIKKLVSTERELIELCVANNLYGNSEFLYEHEFAETNYKRWRKIKQSLTYSLSRDLDHIYELCYQRKQNLTWYLQNQVINDLLSQKVEYESIILLDKQIKCMDKIQGFDSSKYTDRMVKSSKFVNQGVSGHIHKSHIDSFLANMKGIKNGNISITTP